MASVRRSTQTEAHPLFVGVFADWHAKAGAMSALPNAPVVPEEPRRRRPASRWLRRREIDWPRARRQLTVDG
ncbi:hypothetical protein ACKI1I_37950 [Streptomyces turgidiscabies]|uniref:Uncharacterized protein n=1 Tax=Streptomyces turgidiscabies (strain Car8) TaxID=698760 RepID=L7FCZ5_STRT8|nr:MULTISPECIES: hypothetical protein [Streptomyces]ELP68941.1 hypothetical protein STRTUCAR8_05824 [Streptomyces turgidiscabies Car8]MDX3499468.1 hypothetical protein [Streptomyces turgidiscabies]GAQ77111.1 hypothetical protein T45_08927 [Streptomyces turgidiscabies]